jgi:hypothetical protein
MIKSKRGGVRPNSGAKLKYGEPTTTIAFRVPISEKSNIQRMMKLTLKKYQRPATMLQK